MKIDLPKFSVLIALALALGAPAFSYGGVMENIIAPTVGLKQLMVMLAYIFGVGFVVAGLMKYPKYRSNPSETPLSIPVSLVALGLALIILPWVASHSSGAKVKESDIGSPYQFIGE